MINWVDFVSLNQLESMSGDASWSVISITDTDKSDARVSLGFGMIMKIKFDDIDDAEFSSGSRGRLFTSSDARLILDFLEKIHKNNSCHGVLVQCEAGKSRSAAIAVFISGFYGAKFTHCRRVDGYNNFVLRLLERSSKTNVSRPTDMVVRPGL